MMALGVFLLIISMVLYLVDPDVSNLISVAGTICILVDIFFLIIQR